MKIPAGTKVRLRTTNGGDTVVVLVNEYVPTYGAYFRYEVSPHQFWVEAERIKSVEPVDASGIRDDLTVTAGPEFGEIDVVRRVDTVILTQFDQEIKLDASHVHALRKALYALAPQGEL